MDDREYQAALARLSDDQLAGMLATDLTNKRLAFPLYCPFILVEADIEKHLDRIPLCYVWNENKNNGSFTISVNGFLVGGFLEAHISSSDGRFNRVRDKAVELLRQTGQQTVLAICRQYGAMPSALLEHVE